MSDTDSFIREVTEEVRQDRMFRLWKRYGPYALTAIAVVVGATAVMSWLEHERERAAMERGGTFLSVDADDPEANRALAAEMDGPAAVIADLRLAKSLAASGDTGGAVEVFDRVAAMPDLPQHYTDLAKLSSIRLRALSGELSALIDELGPLAATGAPYRPLALELRAALRLNAGEAEGARADLSELLSDPRASGETRARAEALRAALPPEG